MKKKPEKERRELILGLWGDGCPYSQVRVEREIRIMGNSITREMFYVFANINPTTIQVLQRGRKKITDPAVLKIVDEAKYRGPQDGYVYWPTDRLQNNIDEANKLGLETAKVIESMHALIIEWLGLNEEKTNNKYFNELSNS